LTIRKRGWGASSKQKKKWGINKKKGKKVNHRRNLRKKGGDSVRLPEREGEKSKRKGEKIGGGADKPERREKTSRCWR